MLPVRSPSLLLIVLLLPGVLLCGCAQMKAEVEDQVLALTTSPPDCSPGTRQAPGGSLRLLDEANRQLSAMKESHYTHTTYVDEERGVYDYDCSGFAGYALSRADPCAFQVLLHKRPDTGNFYYHLVRYGPDPGPGGWMRVYAPLDLEPGDLIVWVKSDESESGSTGHIMIVADTPYENPARKGEILVRVIDSTTSPHAGDTRDKGTTGLGEGTIGIMTGPEGAIPGYYWRGGISTSLQGSGMVFARIA